MFRQLFDNFARDCAGRIARGEGLDAESADAFALYLDALELTGHRLLGKYAGPDPSFDTFTGRCGLPVVLLRR
ncbi:MAG: hypothetical protein HYX53_14305 [Chloroflexi bacterium]|nr:hypothetical protein [Chloroflexota bacterium]